MQTRFCFVFAGVQQRVCSLVLSMFIGNLSNADCPVPVGLRLGSELLPDTH